jgi:hypothetical protein
MSLDQIGRRTEDGETDGAEERGAVSTFQKLSTSSSASRPTRLPRHAMRQPSSQPFRIDSSLADARPSQ